MDHQLKQSKRRAKKKRTVIKTVSVKVEFDVAERATHESSDVRVTITATANGEASSRTLELRALKGIERSILPRRLVQNMEEHLEKFLPERLREVTLDLAEEGKATMADGNSRKHYADSVRDEEAKRARDRMGILERDREKAGDRRAKKRAEWEAKILRAMRAIPQDERTKAEVARRVNLGSERTRTQAINKILDRYKLNWEQFEKQVNN